MCGPEIAKLQGSMYVTPAIDVDGEHEWRCPYCGKLLLKGIIEPGSKIETRCPRPRCRKYVKLEVI